MEDIKAFELAKWINKVANKYNISVLTITETFKRELDEHKEIEIAKLSTVNRLTHRG